MLEQQSMTPPPGERFSTAHAPNVDTLQFALEDGEGRATQLIDYTKSPGGFAVKGTAGFSLSKTAKTTVVAYTANPLLNPDAFEFERFSAADWSTKASLQFGSIIATGEAFGG